MIQRWQEEKASRSSIFFFVILRENIMWLLPGVPVCGIAIIWSRPGVHSPHHVEILARAPVHSEQVQNATCSGTRGVSPHWTNHSTVRMCGPIRGQDRHTWLAPPTRCKNEHIWLLAYIFKHIGIKMVHTIPSFEWIEGIQKKSQWKLHWQRNLRVKIFLK